MSGLLLAQPNAVTPIDTFNEGRNNALLGRAFSAAPDARNGLIGDVAMTDPRQALAFQGALQTQDESAEDRKQKALVNMARFYTSAPEQARSGLRAQLAPALAKFGIDAASVSPEDFDKTAQAIVAAWTPTNAIASGTREFEASAAAAGLKPGTPEYQQAAKVGLGLAPRAVTGAAKTGMITGADGRERPYVFDPATQQYSVFDGSTWSPLGQQDSARLAAGGAGASPATPARPTTDQLMQQATQMANEGGPGKNAQAAQTWLYSQLDKYGYGPSTSTAGAAGAPPANGGLGVGRPAEETAGATERAKQQAQLDYLPQTEAIKAHAAVDQAGATVTAKGMAERQLDQPQAQASLSDATGNLDRLADTARRIMQHPGLRGITSWQSKIPDLPGSDAANAHAELEALKSQVGFGVLQAMRNASKTGGALGSVSDNEQGLLQSNLAALQQSQSPEAFRQNLQRIIDYTTQAKSRLNGAFQQTYQSGQHSQPSATSSQSGAHAPVDDLLSKYGVR